MNVDFNGLYSYFWKDKSRVRQCGVASAYRFCLKIDDMLKEIDKDK